MSRELTIDQASVSFSKKPILMSDHFKRIIVLCLVFVTAFMTVHLFRTWQGKHGLFSIWKQEDRGQFAPEFATLAKEAAMNLEEVPGLARANDEMVALVGKVTPAVVSIDTEILKKERLFDPYRGRIYERNRLTPGLGSGVIVSQEGHVITNQHVIEGHHRIRVTLHDGRSLPATLINSDRLLDIAVLRIKSSDPNERFEALKFGDSDKVRVGQLAIAVGNPYGLGESVTVGRISARDRSLSDGQRDLFQTDAAINPGNSGGPLLNHLGEIIAINASIYSEDRENPGFQGIGFSIPSNEVKRTMEYILDKGRPVHGYLGLRTLDLNDYLKSVLNYQGEGVVVWDVTPGSPAAESGIERFDIITSFQEEGVTSTAGFINRVQRSKVGSLAKLGVYRGSETLLLEATITETDLFEAQDDESAAEREKHDRAIYQAVGLEVKSRGRQAVGVIVSSVTEGGLAAQAGLQRGDFVLEINGSRIRNAEDFYLRLVATAAVQETELFVFRGNSRARLVLPKVPRVTSDPITTPVD